MTREMFQARDETARPAAPTFDEKLEQLDRILRSRVFQDSELLGTLLQYLVRQSTDDPNSQVKEYTIALEVFGRDSEFDPRTNSIVRVQVKNLRAKLQAYYDAEGRSDKVLIEIPRGHYKATFSYIEPKEAPVPEPAPAASVDVALPAAGPGAPRRRTDPTKTVLIVTTIVLSVVVVLLALSEADVRKHAQAEARPDTGNEGSAVWAPFLRPNASTLLILSNPPVYRFLNNSDSRSTSDNAIPVPPEQARELAKRLENKLVMRQGRAPRLVLSTSSYTGVGEAIGLHLLTDLFRSSGKDLTLKQSRTVSADDLKNHNVILLGSAWVNDWVERLPVKEDFVFTVDASIENENPLPGEDREYKPRYNDTTGLVEEDYALITVKPGITDEHRLMTLAGILSEGTQAASEFVTKREYLDELDRRLRQASDAGGPPPYYQVLLKVGVDNGIPTTVTLLAVHPLKVTRK